MVKAGVKKLVFSSSCATYGFSNVSFIEENHPQNPINPYGASKLMAERIIADFGEAYGIACVVFRYFNAAGADPEGDIGEWHNPETHLIPLVLDVALGKKESVSIHGTDYDTPDGTCVRDFVHVCDIAQAHVLGLTHLLAGRQSDCFNLSNRDGYSVRQVIQEIEKVTGKKIRTLVTSRRPGDPPRLVGSFNNAATVLGWRPEFPSLDSMVRSAWNWHQKLSSDIK
jgi:UDP-glucose 4-epimerase